jgi:Zn-dependent protease
VRGDIIVSLAGVATNLVIAFFCWVLFPLFGMLGRAVGSLELIASILQAMMIQGLFLNLILIVFNLIPIPPLDGSHVLKHLLPRSLSLRYQQVSRYGILVLVALLFMAPGALSFMMAPAFKTFGWSYSHIEGSQLAQTQRWLR